MVRPLALPSPEQLRDLSAELSGRVAAQEEAAAGLSESEADMRAMNADLERRAPDAFS